MTSPKSKTTTPRRAWLLATVTVALGGAAAIVWLAGPWGTGLPPRELREQEQSSKAAAPANAATAAQPTAAGASAVGDQRQRTAAEPRHVYGVLRQGGEPVAARLVRLFGPGGTQAAETAADGAFRFEVEDGRHRLAVPWTDCRVVERPRFGQRDVQSFAPPAAVTADVEVRGRSVQQDLELAAGVVTVRVLDETTSLGVLGAQIARAHGFAFELVAQTDAAGLARLDDLELGAHTLTIACRGYGLLREVATLSAATRRVHVDVHLEPCGALDVRLVDEFGQPQRISAATRLDVCEAESGMRAMASNQHEFVGPERPTVLRYDGLEPGRHRVAFADEQAGPQLLRYQPTDTGAERVVDVPAGRVTTLDLPVRYRAYAQLRGHDAEGRLTAGTLAVERADERQGLVRILPAPWQSGARTGNAHFEGYLAPGVYTLTFEQGGRQHRESLVVARENLDRTFVLPW